MLERDCAEFVAIQKVTEESSLEEESCSWRVSVDKGGLEYRPFLSLFSPLLRFLGFLCVCFLIGPILLELEDFTCSSEGSF